MKGRIPIFERLVAGRALEVLRIGALIFGGVGRAGAGAVNDFDPPVPELGGSFGVRGKHLTSPDHAIREGNSVMSDPAVHPRPSTGRSPSPRSSPRAASMSRYYSSMLQ
jgi:hypothetical protein